MNDRDLREALAPLAGDPVQDAARVLKALPPRGPGGNGPRRVPPVGWWLLGSGLLLGTLAGLWYGPGQAPAPAPLPVAPVTQPAQPKEEKPEEKPKEEQPKEPQPANPMLPREDMLYLMAFGKVHVDEPGGGAQDLQPGGFWVALGTTVATDDGAQAGLYRQADDSRLRSDYETVATASPGEVRLHSGRVWIGAGQRGAEIRLVTDLATIQLSHAEAIAIRETTGVAVIAVQGELLVRTSSGQSTKLEQGSQVWIDADRGMSALEKVPFLPASTSWMTHMLLQEQDESALKSRVGELVDAYVEGSQRAAASQEIHKLGSRCVAGLVQSIEKRLPADPDYARATTALAADVADFRGALLLLALLAVDDAEVRVRACHGSVRATGMDGGTDETLWRNGSLEQRQAAITLLWKLLK
jgi:hypothetical protein